MTCKIKAWSDPLQPHALMFFRPYVPAADPSTTCTSSETDTEEGTPTSKGRHKGGGGADDEPLCPRSRSFFLSTRKSLS